MAFINYYQDLPDIDRISFAVHDLGNYPFAGAGQIKGGFIGGQLHQIVVFIHHLPVFKIPIRDRCLGNPFPELWQNDFNHFTPSNSSLQFTVNCKLF